MRRSLHAVPALLALTLPAAAQSFNLDVGPNLILASAPADTYGAAAGQTGHWMEFRDPFFATPLEGLDGLVTGVTLESDSMGSFTVFPSVVPTAGDQELMEDAQWLPNLDTTVTWTFAGLADGTYDLYTYAADPSSGSVVSEISVVGSNDPPQQVGSAWPGGHVLGLTYARHRVDVVGGGLVVQAKGVGGAPDDSGALNGFQLVEAQGGPVGQNYCGPAVLNSQGLSAVMSGTGSDVAAANDLTLTASLMPPNQFGYFLLSETLGFVPNPGGSQGNLCLAGNIGRYNQQVANTGAGGTFLLKLDLTSVPTAPPAAVAAGETWHFQAWYRDVNPTPTSNFTDGLRVLFQ